MFFGVADYEVLVQLVNTFDVFLGIFGLHYLVHLKRKLENVPVLLVVQLVLLREFLVVLRDFGPSLVHLRLRLA